MTRYYHGGVPSLGIGARVLPPSLTGRRCSSDYGAEVPHRRDRVYVSTEPEAAAIWCALYPTFPGGLYEVLPSGLEADPDCSAPGLSFATPHAIVVRVLRPDPKLLLAIRHQLLGELTQRSPT